MLRLIQALHNLQGNHNRIGHNRIGPVCRLGAFLCLPKRPQWFPLPSFAPFPGCNSLSAFTAIVEDLVPMRLAVLFLRKTSPLTGEPR
jgi:hypothetical protein